MVDAAKEADSEGQWRGTGLGRVCFVGTFCFAIRAAIDTVGQTPVGVPGSWPLSANAATGTMYPLRYDDGRPTETARLDYLHYPHPGHHLLTVERRPSPAAFSATCAPYFIPKEAPTKPKSIGRALAADCIVWSLQETLDMRTGDLVRPGTGAWGSQSEAGLSR